MSTHRTQSHIKFEKPRELRPYHLFLALFPNLVLIMALGPAFYAIRLLTLRTLGTLPTLRARAAISAMFKRDCAPFGLSALVFLIGQTIVVILFMVARGENSFQATTTIIYGFVGLVWLRCAVVSPMRIVLSNGGRAIFTHPRLVLCLLWVLTFAAPVLPVLLIVGWSQ